MKKLKIILPLFFIGLLLFNISFLSKTANDPKLDLKTLSTLNTANAEIPDNTYYCYFSFQAGIYPIRLCDACVIMWFVYPDGYDGMCWTGA